MKNKINSPSSSSRRRSGVALETLADTINVDDEESKQTGTRSRASLSRPFNDEKGPTVFPSSVFRWKSTTEDVPESQSVSKIVQPRAVSNRTTITSVYIENTKKKKKKKPRKKEDPFTMMNPSQCRQKVFQKSLSRGSCFIFQPKTVKSAKCRGVFEAFLFFVFFLFCFFLINDRPSIRETLRLGRIVRLLSVASVGSSRKTRNRRQEKRNHRRSRIKGKKENDIRR